jgi:hypothetical protein
LGFYGKIEGVKKGILKFGIFLLVTALFVGGGLFYFSQNQAKNNKTEVLSEQNTVDNFKVSNTQPAATPQADATLDTLTLKKTATGAYEPKLEYISDTTKANNEFTAVAPIWTATIPAGTSLDVYVKVISKSGETDWIKVEKGEGKSAATAGNEFFSEVPVLYTGTSYKYKIVLATQNTAVTPSLEKIRFELINSLGQKTTWDFSNFFATKASAAGGVISRSAWGCPEATSSPDWNPEYAPVQKIILHHTDSQSNPVDPAADIRAIWYYHAKTLGWGDIGYNYLVDQNGGVYEGRFGGANVIAGHTLGFNTGSMGVAMLGDFTNNIPTNSALGSLESFLGQKSFEYGINPLGSGYFSSSGGSIDPKTVFTGTIDLHRSYSATACPGQISLIINAIRTGSNDYYLDARNRSYVVTSPVTLSNPNPAIGETVTASYWIQNTTTAPVTFNYIGVGTRLNGTVGVDMGWQQNITVAAGGYYNVIVQRTYTELGYYNYWASYSINGSFYRAASQNGQSVLGGFNTHWPNIFATTMITTNPNSPIAGQSANYRVTITNGEAKRITFAHLGIAAYNVVNRTPVDIGWIDGSYLDPGASVVIDQNRALSVGKYYVYSSVGIGNAFNSLWDGGGPNKIYVEPIEQVSILEGVPIPATSGLVGREQHLSVSACSETPTTHYALTGVFASAQNGMAWQTSGGCGYGAWGTPPSAANEQYYVNMRWNYTNANGQAVLAPKSWYYGKKVIVTNPATGQRVVAAVIEYGPGIMSRVAGLSPEAMLAVSAVTNNNLNYYWAANQSLALGPLN